MIGTILVTGGTGKTGRGVVRGLRALGLPVRSAARTGGNARFEWTEPSTYDNLLRGVAGVYLLAPPLEPDPSSETSAVARGYPLPFFSDGSSTMWRSRSIARSHPAEMPSRKARASPSRCGSSA